MTKRTITTPPTAIRAAYDIRTQVPAEDSTGAPYLTFVASTPDLDRYGEVIDPAGWQLENFRRNPVFQNAHRYGDILFTLGRCAEISVQGDALIAKVEFAVDINPLARIAYGLYKGGFLNAVSVGFIPLRWEDGTQKTEWYRRYLEQELVELSAVPVPANPEALILGLKADAFTETDIEDSITALHAALSARPMTNNQSSILNSQSHPTPCSLLPAHLAQSHLPLNSQLLLARELHRILRG